MSQKNCFICYSLLDNFSFSGVRASTKCSVKSVLEVLGISYTSFVGDLLKNQGYELVNDECSFCYQCSILIGVTEGLLNRFRVSKQKLVDRVAAGYKKRRKCKQTVQVSTAAQVAKRLAHILGECFARSSVVIRPEDVVSVELSTPQEPVAVIKVEGDQQEDVVLDDTDDGFGAISEGSEFYDLNPSLTKKRRMCRLSFPEKPLNGEPRLEEVAEKSEKFNDNRRSKRKSDGNASGDLDASSKRKSRNSASRLLRARKSNNTPEEVDLSTSDSEADEASANEFGSNGNSSDGVDSSEPEIEEGTTNQKPKRVRKQVKNRNDSRRFPCGKCNLALVNISSLDKHVISSHAVRPVDRFYGCAICPAMFHTAEDLKKHVVYYTVAKSQKQKCLLCEFSDNLPALVGHYFKEHGLDFLKCKYFGCIQCFQAFNPTSSCSRSGFAAPGDLPSFKLFTEEHRNCSKPRELSVHQQCRFCPETRLTAADLISHESTHFPDLQCTFCDLELNDKDDLKVHNGIYHKQFRNLKPRVVPVRLPNQEVRTPRNWKCTICNQRFVLAEALEAHVKTHAAGKKIDVNLVSNFKETVDYRCPLCNFTCSAHSSMYRHLSVLHNLMLFNQLDDYFYSCYVCWAIFEPSDPSELPGRLLPKDVDKLKEFTTEHAGCSRVPISEFTCPNCSEKFTRPKHLFKHCLKCIQSLSKYQCTECASELDNNVEFLCHMREAHVDRLKFKCQCYKCGKYCKNSEALQNHVLESSNLLRCPCCCQNFKGSESYKKHTCAADQVPEPEEVTFNEVPPHCTQLNGGFPCLSCDKVFSSVDLLSVHFQEHHGKANEISFNCSACSTILSSSETLRKIGDESFYSTKYSLKHPDFTSLCSQHWKTCISSPDATPCCKLAEPSFGCYICNHIQDSPQALAIHLNEHHGAFEVQKCPGCTLVFLEKKNLHTHLRNDHKLRTWVRGRDRYFCYQCYEPFRSTNQGSELGLVDEADLPQLAAFLERHFLCKAKKVPPNCHHCPAKFFDVPNLFAHEIRFHSKNFEHYCEQCGKGFPTGSHLNEHRKKVHETSQADRKKHECHICLKRFVQRNYLKQHLTSHEDKQPPLVCQYCGKGFNFKSNLVRHEKNVHK